MPEDRLDHHRGTPAPKCAGPDDAQVRLAPAEPSAPTLLGPVRHLAEAERNWLQRIIAGSDVPPVSEVPSGCALGPARGLDGAPGPWRGEAERGRELRAGLTLEDTGRVTGAEVGPRRVLIHLIEEYARHNGHADLLRERVDGVTGA